MGNKYISAKLIIPGIFMLIAGFSLFLLFRPKNPAVNNLLPVGSPTPVISNPEISYSDISCTNNSDCELVVADSWSDCNLGNDCQPLDYSQSKWISVNSIWYKKLRNTNCPPADYPAKGCFPKPINDNFSSVCVKQICHKTPVNNTNN